jgi:hypothetical protein
MSCLRCPFKIWCLIICLTCCITTLHIENILIDYTETKKHALLLCKGSCILCLVSEPICDIGDIIISFFNVRFILKDKCDFMFSLPEFRFPFSSTLRLSVRQMDSYKF